MFIMRDGLHGVTYLTEEIDEGWTPVRRERVEGPVPLHLACHRAPPRIRATSSSDKDSDSLSTSLTIPDHAAVNYHRCGFLSVSRN